MVLVKDNHLGALGVSGAVKQARELWPGKRVEVECERPEQVAEAIAAGADMVMLDNMTPAEAADCVRLVRESSRPDTLVEVSGGVTLHNAAAYAASGANLLSTSVITQSAPALDIALDLAIT
jgi:nicotinate-nucleotide pyrophosphorylase (carboxylating)